MGRKRCQLVVEGDAWFCPVCGRRVPRRLFGGRRPVSVCSVGPIPVPKPGLGDVVAWVIDWLGLAWLARYLPRDKRGGCGCDERREELNRRFPFPEWLVPTLKALGLRYLGALEFIKFSMRR